VISTGASFPQPHAIFEFTSSAVECRGYQTLDGAPIVVPGPPARSLFGLMGHAITSIRHQRRRLGTTGPGDRPRRLARGGGGAGVGRDRSVRKLGTSNSRSTAWCATYCCNSFGHLKTSVIGASAQQSSLSDRRAHARKGGRTSPQRAQLHGPGRQRSFERCPFHFSVMSQISESVTRREK
jgi:hypothetical protein